jgi:hypothetical protein
MKALCCLLILCASPALAQNGTWLQPSDRLFTQAIEIGFARQKLPKNELYQTRVIGKIQSEPSAHIEVQPPLVCALTFGQQAHDKLLPKPALDTVRDVCSGRLTVMVFHYSVNLGANWPCVLQSGGTTLQPANAVRDSNPRVEHFRFNFLQPDVIGYSYGEVYVFEVPKDWSQGADLVYADDLGNHHTVKLDFGSFANDIARR